MSARGGTENVFKRLIILYYPFEFTNIFHNAFDSLISRDTKLLLFNLDRHGKDHFPILILDVLPKVFLSMIEECKSRAIYLEIKQLISTENLSPHLNITVNNVGIVIIIF